MSEPSSKPPTYEEILRPLLAALEGPIPVDDLASQILELRPSKANNPHLAALKGIRQEEGRLLVYLDKDHVLPLRLAFEGARYRLRLTREQVDQAVLPFDECFQLYLPSPFDLENLRLIDKEDKSIPFQTIEISRKVPFSLSGEREYKEPAIALKEWFHSQRMYFKDHILVTVVNREKGVLRLERQRYGDQHADQIDARNKLIADQIYAMLEAAPYQQIYILMVLPTIYARLPDKDSIPPDHWKTIVEKDPRLATDGWAIHYADGGFSRIEKLAMELAREESQSIKKSFTKEEGRQVYRFRASFKNKPSTWRDVEILGRQDLGELDSILRDAFNHDTFDHLSGFWKKVARAGVTRKRYREVDLGEVNPFEPTEEQETEIAALALNPGDQLKYVYDFGDWIEHSLEVKSVGEAEPGAKYPREVARNKPKYLYCVDCAEKGKQTIAAWVCVSCSQEKQEEVVLCKKCLEEHEDHEDHYIKEITY